VPAHVRVICFTAYPSSTQGEAEYLAHVANEEHLKSVDVVTSQFHVFRARIILKRCYKGELHMVGAPQPWWKMPWYALTEQAKLAYQLVIARSC
jgi:uncharacterized SAM-binding protein YcdF (DUF218 family)